MSGLGTMPGLGTPPIVEVYHEKSIILPDVSRVLACLYEKDIKFKTHTASYKSLLRLQASSHAPVPFYEGSTFLEESREICRYIAEKHQGYPFLLGKDALERISVEQWLHNEEHAFNPPSRALFCHLAFPLGEEDDGDDIGMHTRKLEEVLDVYEQRLSDSEFLAGNKFTLADLVHLPNSHYITASDEFLYLYDSRKNVRRWWDAISTRDSWQQVLRDMKRVEVQHKQEELEKQQQHQQKEHPTTSGHPIKIYSKKQISTEPRTILVPPADIVSSSPTFSQTEKPLPIDTFPDEALVSSSQSTPTTDKTSAVQSKETTIFSTPQETPPTSVQSAPTTTKKSPIPVQSTSIFLAPVTSPTTAEKPPIADAAKSGTKDASSSEPSEIDLPTRHKPSSSRDVSSNLHVFDYYKTNSHTEEMPYIGPTPQKNSETLDTFSDQSNIAAGHTKTSPISAKEEPDQPSASDFYKSDNTATGVDSQYKQSVPYSEHTPPKLKPTDTATSKLHSTDVHHRLQAEQWHAATAGLNNLKEDADHLMPTQQVKPRKEQYPSQDSEQATSYPVSQEPMSMELVQGREKTTRGPYTDQRRDVLSPLSQQTPDARGIAEDKASSDQRGALLPPSTQEHPATPPSRKAAAKDARSTTPSQAGYPGGRKANKQPRVPGSIPIQTAAQDLDDARHTNAPFQKRYPGIEDTTKQAKDVISTPWQMTDQEVEDTTEETKIADSSSSRVEPLYFQKAEAPSRKQETTEDLHDATSPIQKRHANFEDTTGQSRGIAFKPKQMIGQDDQDTFKETKSGDPSLLREQSSDAQQAATTPTEQEANQDGLSVAPPSRAQTRYPSATPPSKTGYPIAKDASKQSRRTASTPRQKATQDDNDTSEESKTANEVASTEEPLNARGAPIAPRRQEIEDSTKETSFQKRYPYVDGGKDTFEETKLADSTPTSAKPMYTQQAALPPPRHAEVEDARDKGRQSRVTIPEPQKMVARDAQDAHGERKTGTPGEQPSDRPQAIPQSRPAAAKDARGATDESIQFPDILDSTKKSGGTFEETKGPGSTLPRAQSLGAQDAQRTNGESRTLTANQRKDVSTQLQSDAQDPFQQSKLSAMDQKGLGSLSSQERDAKDAQATMSEEKSVSTGQLRDMIKQSESTTPKAQPTDSQGSIKVEKISSVYQKKPLVAYDSQEQVQIIPAGEKADGSTTKHQQTSDAPYAFDEKLSATAPSRAKARDDFSKEEPYKKDITDDQKVVPPLLSKEPTSQVQPPSESLQDAAPHGSLSTKPSTIYQWQRASVPLHDVTTSSGDDENGMATIDQKLTPMSQRGTLSAEGANQIIKDSAEQRVEPPIPIETKTSGAQRASPSLPGASIADDATIDNKFAKQSIIDERVAEPIQMQAPSPDAHPASAPPERATPDGHEIGDLEHVSKPDGQISEAAKARHDPATVHEDVHDANLSTHDVAKDTFKETKVADSTPSSAKPMHTQQPALTPSRHEEVKDARDKGRKSSETIVERQNMVERKTGTSGEQSSDRLKAISPSRQAAAEDARDATGDTIRSPDILDTSKNSRGTFEEAKGPGSTLPKAQSLGAQDAQRTNVESTTPTADQRKDVSTKPQSNVQDVFQQSKLSDTDQKGLGSLSSDGKDVEAIMTEEKSFSTERLREMPKEIESTTPKAQPTDSQGSIAKANTSSVYQKRPLATQDSGEQAHIIPAGADGSTLKHQQASDAPYTFDEKLSASAPARADIRDDDSAEEPYKKDTTDDQKVTPPLLSKEPTSQVQPPSEPSQDAALHGDLSSKPSTIDQWQCASAPLHGVSTNTGDTEMAMSSNIDQKPISMSQEATLSSQSVNQMAEQSGEQRVEPPVPIGTETSDLRSAAPSLLEAARADHATIDDKFAKPSIIDERVGEPKQMQALITDAHPASAPTKRKTPDGHETGDLELASTSEGQRLEAAKGTHDPATIHDDAHDANFSTHDAAIDEKTATYHASGDQLVTGSLHDQQARPPASTQAQPTETPHYAALSQYVHTDASSKTELAKPTVTDQEAKAPIAGPTSTEPQFGGTLPAEVAHAEQKPAPSDQESAWAAQPLSPVEPAKIDNNVSAADYTDAPQIIFRQQARPSAPSTGRVPALDTQGVIRKIQEVTPDNHRTDDSGKPLVPSQEQVSQASQDSMAPMVDQASAPDTQRGIPQGEAAPAEQKFVVSDQESPHASESPPSAEPRTEQTDAAADDQLNAPQGPQTTIGHQVKAPEPDARDALRKDQQPSRDDDHISNLADTLIASQEQTSPAGHASELREGPTPEIRSAAVEKKTPLPSSRAKTSDTGPDSTPISGDVPDTSYLQNQEAQPPVGTQEPTTQALQGSASAQNISLGKINESPMQPSTDQVKASSAVPSDAPQGTEPGANSVQPPQQASMASMVDLASAPDTQRGIPQGEAAPAEQKIAVSDQESPHASESPPSAEPRTEQTDAAADDQPNAPQGPQTTIGHQVKAPEPDARDALRKDQQPSRDDDHISNLADTLIASQEQTSPAGHSSELREGPTPEMRSAAVEKKTPLPSSRAKTSDTGPDSTPISGDVPDTSYLQNQEAQPPVGTQEPTTQALQGFASAQNISLGKINESPMQPSTDQVKASSAVPSDAPQGTEPGANSVQPPQQASMASMVDLASAPDTQRGIPQGETTPAEQKIAVSDQESPHASESPPSAEPRTEQTDAAADDQPNAPQGPQTTIGHQVKAPEPDARDALRKDQQPSRDDDHISNLADTLIASQEQTSPAGHSSELREGPTPEMRSAAVEKKTPLPSSRAKTSDTGPDSTPISGDVPDTSYLQNQEAQPPVGTQEPTTQALQGSASAQNISLGKINESPMQSSTDQVKASSAVPSDAPQGTEPGTNSVQPPQEASFDFSSDEKTTMTQGDPVNTLLNDDLSTSEAVGQSASGVSKGINFQKNLEGASTDEKFKAQQQIDQSDAQSSKEKNKEVNGTVRSNILTTFGELQKQPSWPKENMDPSEEPEHHQLADQAIVQSLQGNNKQVEETKAQDTGTDKPEEREGPENTNVKNRLSEVEALDHSGKQASGVQLLGENPKDVSNSTEDTPGDTQKYNKSKDNLRSSEESKVQLQTEGKTQGGETEQPKEGGLPENSYQNNGSQSQAEASDKSIEQSPPGVQNKNKTSSRLDGPTNATKSGDMEDDSQ